MEISWINKRRKAANIVVSFRKLEKKIIKMNNSIEELNKELKIIAELLNLDEKSE